MSLTALAQFATKNNNSRTMGKPVHLLSLEEARAKVSIRNGDRKPAVDGSQALTVTLGRIRLNLDVIAEGATRINASADQVDEFTAVLTAAVNEGKFDDAITEAQVKANPMNSANKVTATADTTEYSPYGVALGAAPDGVDLGELG